MKRSLLNKWIARLEDPTTKQGKNMLLKKDGSMCCLGVLCDIVDPNGWTEMPDEDWGLLRKFFVYNKDSNSSYLELPKNLADELNMFQTGYPIEGKKDSIALINMNDDGISFKEIAALLRNNPKVYIRTIEEDV